MSSQARKPRSTGQPVKVVPTVRKSNKAMKYAVWATILAVLVAVYSIADSIKERWYIFDPPVLNALAQEAIELNEGNMTAIISHITTKLAATHPAYTINTDFTNPSEWVFNNAGGAMGSMFIIHASITEYLIIFGTALGTEGHTGRHTADDFFNILQGEQWAYSAGALEKEVYKAGSVHHLRRGEVKQYKFHEGGWALEYARGWIPPMLPFGLADVLFSTLDFISFYHTGRLTAREMIKNLLHGKI